MKNSDGVKRQTRGIIDAIISSSTFGFSPFFSVSLLALGLGALDIRHQVLILGADVVVGKGVICVAGIGHVVGVEGLLRYVVIHCLFHHLQVGGGIARLHVQAAVDGGKIVAHVGVGVDPVVKGADVVVVGLGLHPRLGGKEVAQTEGQIVLLRHGEAHPAQVGHQAHAQAVLPVGGQVGEAVVEVAEHDALIGHAVEGGGALRVDEIGGKGLGAHHNQVVVLKQAGVGILGRPLEGGEILVQAAQALVLGGLIQGVEVHAVQHVLGAPPSGGEVHVVEIVSRNGIVTCHSLLEHIPGIHQA